VPRRAGLSFLPNDRVMDVFGAMTSYRIGGDGLELESFDALLEKRHGARVDELWHGRITLGEIFAATRAAARDPGRS